MRRILVLLVGLVLGASQAFAAGPWDAVEALEIDTTPYIATVVIILGSLSVMWIGRKLIKLWNRS